VILNALVFGLTIAFMVVGMIGMLVPIIPGTILIWLGVVGYAIVENFQAIDFGTLVIISLIGIVTGTADLWLALLGAKSGGASGLSILYGMVGGILGFLILGTVIPIVGSLFGGVFGYALGILLGQYHKHRDWNLAIRASFGGIVGWGVATVVQVAGGIMMVAIFVWQVLSY
jgi:uncharacterized protein YqgC (DUF456 family)